jgi:predicted O-linked N-acetylglucosamine transferase (SPINDLY family)
MHCVVYNKEMSSIRNAALFLSSITKQQQFFMACSAMRAIALQEQQASNCRVCAAIDASSRITILKFIMLFAALCLYSLPQQNVTILHRMVQTLGGIKDNAELRG